MTQADGFHTPVEIAARIRGKELAVSIEAFAKNAVFTQEADDQYQWPLFLSKEIKKEHIVAFTPFQELGYNESNKFLQEVYTDIANIRDAPLIVEAIKKTAVHLLLARHGSAIAKHLSDAYPQNERLKALAMPEYGEKLEGGVPYVVNAFRDTLNALPEFASADKNQAFLTYASRLAASGSYIARDEIGALLRDEAPAHVFLMRYVDADAEFMKQFSTAYTVSCNERHEWTVDYRPEQIADLLTARIDEAQDRMTRKMQFSRKGALRFANHTGMRQPFAPPLTDEAARICIMPALVFLLPQSGLHGAMMRLAAADPTLTIHVVTGSHATPYEYSHRKLDKEFFETPVKVCGGFQSSRDSSICVPVETTTQQLQRVLAEELIHHAMFRVYRNNSLPYPEGDNARRLALKQAVRMDLEGMGRDIKQLRHDLHFTAPLYQGKDMDTELPVKVLMMRAAGEWMELPRTDTVMLNGKHMQFRRAESTGGSHAEKYGHLADYVDKIVAEDVKAYLANKPLPVYTLEEACAKIGVLVPKRSERMERKPLQAVAGAVQAETARRYSSASSYER